MAEADLVFLPWTRRGASAGILTPDTFGSDQPGKATALTTLTINGLSPVPSTVPMPTTVMGPGNVTGLDGRQVIRTDPAPNTRTFESNYLALIELDEPALPWLFTPAAAGAQARLRPWLCLVVVRPQDGVRLDPPQGSPLPVLRIGGPARPSVELPDLADSWAWAHAQVTAGAGADLAATLANPAGSLARLLCPRILLPDTDYLACVVPTFELGRKAGLGQPITDDDEAHLAPAWTQTSTFVELPVYYSWTFATGAGGDFESLALLLRARPLPEGTGTMAIDVGHSGLVADIPEDTTFPVTGALQPIGTPPVGWPDPDLVPAWETAIVPVLNAPSVATGDPLLAPTLYGAAPAGTDAVDPAALPGRWFEQLNLSPAYRAIAHLGTRVVQQLQDQLMASAWAQADDLERANQQRRRTELAAHLAERLHARHLATMSTQAGLQVLAPAQGRMTLGGGTYAAALNATLLGPEDFAPALRRLARPRGAINRRLQRAAEPGGDLRLAAPMGFTTSMLARLQPNATRLRIEALQAPPGEMTLQRLSAALNPPQTNFTWTGSTAAEVTSARQNDVFAFLAPGQRVASPPNDRRRRFDNAAAAQFRILAAAHLARFNPVRTDPIPHIAPDGSLDDAFNEGVAGTGTGQTLTLRMRLAGVRSNVDTRVGSGALARLAETTGAVRLSPRFPQPMSQPLTEVAQRLVLPGLDKIPPNTVVPLETNTAFVEAFLVGLNTEMGRELLWRGYPADVTATYFDRFWDASSAPGRPPDIDPIGTWGTRGLGGTGSTEDFVLLLRSELVRRYPDMIVYAVSGTEERHPIFTGAFAPDVRYNGFDIPAAEIQDWSIVLMEHPSAPRFGVEVGDNTGGGSHLPVSQTNAATTALHLRQMPVRITIPATVLLGRT